MRLLLTVMFVLLVSPVLAQSWDSYGNARFGYQAEIPPDFSGYGESDSGDGQIFDNQAQAQMLSFWGGGMADDFEHEVTARMGYAERDGWNISYQATTPEWASFSGQMNKRIFYTRMILLCDRASYGAMTVQYSTRQAADMKPVVERLVSSFRAVC